MARPIRPDDPAYQARRHRAVERLNAWGVYMRHGRSSLVGPAGTMEPAIGRMAGELAEARRRKRKHRGKYGKTVFASMIPGTASGQNWDHEERTDLALAEASRQLRDVAYSVYVRHDSQDDGAAGLGISRAEYNARLARLIDYVVGYFNGSTEP